MSDMLHGASADVDTAPAGNRTGDGANAAPSFVAAPAAPAEPAAAAEPSAPAATAAQAMPAVTSAADVSPAPTAAGMSATARREGRRKRDSDVVTDRESAIPIATDRSSLRESEFWVHRRQAGVVSRGLGFVIDLVIVLTTASLIYFLTVSTLSLFRIDVANCPTFVPIGGTGTLIHNLCRATRGTAAFVSLMVAPTYLLLLWLLGGQTIGMYIAGIRVVRTNGAPLKLRHALLRLAGLAGSLLALGIGLLWCVIDSNRQGWHDKLAGTYVVYWRRQVAYKEANGYIPERRRRRAQDESSPE